MSVELVITPGSWGYVTPDPEVPDDFGRVVSRVDLEEDMEICHLVENYLSYENGRLMAKSPEMFRLLVEIRNWMELPEKIKQRIDDVVNDVTG